MPPARILSIENNPFHADCQEQILAHEGHTMCSITEPMSLAEIAARWCDFQPDIVMMDVLLLSWPANARAIISRLRQGGMDPSSVLIVSILADDPTTVAELTRVGVNPTAFLAKPFGGDELLKAIEGALERLDVLHD